MGRAERRLTVKDVAEAAGVSPMTVSRTLAGGQNVRPDVQERVRAAVRELGYHRNENARSLRPGQSSGLVGVAITNISNPYYSTFALGVEEEAALTGRRILLGNTGEDPEREDQLLRDFLGRRVEGLIIVPTTTTADHLRGAPDVPLVLASRVVPGVEADHVVLADCAGAEEGTGALLDAGHRRIGFLGNLPGIFTSSRRLRGFERAHELRGLSVDPALISTGQQDTETAAVAMGRLLALADPPTAVFCANNRNAIGAMAEIGRILASGERTAAEMPELMSFDDFELSELMPVPVSVIRHDAREMGRRAARLLLDRLDGGGDSASHGYRSIELPVEVVRRTR
ncbi:LacI family DNA-binding transcriptional regulator [Microbacterium gorillae]|uniref:LacI family DNA-binding transcriptional regulator n=1 Tax=Microbacterium gorillae TaxID=1231063 RepID=UPI00058F8522|nr:LacI family DNA-binding transcriptional regulator [Microbacterium gorillae]